MKLCAGVKIWPHNACKLATVSFPYLQGTENQCVLRWVGEWVGQTRPGAGITGRAVARAGEADLNELDNLPSVPSCNVGWLTASEAYSPPFGNRHYLALK